jgi:hypothetical protein
MRFPHFGWTFRRQCGDQQQIRTEEQIADGQATPVCDPALR